MPVITVAAERCKGDGLCEAICPARIFAGSAAGTPPRVTRQDLCVLCGQCIAVCTQSAIANSRLGPAGFTRLGEPLAATPPQLIDWVQRRRSVRAYASRPVPRALLEEVVRVAGYAPTSAHGGEGWVRTVTVVSGPEKMREVAEQTAAYMTRIGRLLDSSVLKVLARWKEEPRSGRAMLPDLRMRLEEYDAGRNAITYDAPAALFVHTPRSDPEPHATCDAALMASLLAAHAHGLGTCWNGWIAMAASGYKLRSFTALRQLLGIPAHHDVYAAATVGWPRYRLHSLPPRETSIRWIE